ncbi:unnamed protein product [Penicillium pancosmium]
METVSDCTLASYLTTFSPLGAPSTARGEINFEAFPETRQRLLRSRWRLTSMEKYRVLYLIVLRILEFSFVSTLAALTVASKAWHQFIDLTHQEAIYTSESKTRQPPGCSRELSFLSDARTFSRLFEGTPRWKSLCKRQTLLARNWVDPRPMSQESVLQIGNDPIWRFRPDFKRRFFVSSSHAGGLNVTDMDTARILWRLPSSLDSDGDAVRPYAHLEYQDGMVVFDREGDGVEVWQADQDGAARGEFSRIAILNHDC